jgi:hypothetical protein
LSVVSCQLSVYSYQLQGATLLNENLLTASRLLKAN